MKKILTIILFGFSGTTLFANDPPPAPIMHQSPLNDASMHPHPMVQFADWYQEMSQKIGAREASSFVLSTVSNDCRPHSRTMMAKNVNSEGFSFIGNLNTEKFIDLQQNPNAAITFNWQEDQRQVNLIGRVCPLTREEAERIFRTRSKAHQISSLMCCEMPNLDTYEQIQQQHEQLMREYQNKDVPMPNTWGGYRFIPQRVEFWQRGTANLHSRINYSLDNAGQWQRVMIRP